VKGLEQVDLARVLEPDADAVFADIVRGSATPGG
jgi:hypothetical protein